MEEILSVVFNARKIYDSGVDTFSLSKERFFLVGDDADPIWIATMEGEPPRAKTYDHVAFKIAESDYDKYLGRIGNMGLQLREGRSRVEERWLRLFEQLPAKDKWIPAGFAGLRGFARLA